MKIRLRHLLLITLLLAAFGVWATWIANDGRGLFFRGEEPPDFEGVLAKLAEPTSIAARHVPLRDFLAQLAAEHDLDIRIDEASPPSLGKSHVFLFADEISVWSAIRLALRQVEREQGLATAIHGESLVITTKQSAFEDHQYYVGRAYPLAPLLMASGAVSEEELAVAIESTIAPGTWENAGGTGVLRRLPGALVVAHTLEVHVEIEQLLSRLQEIGESPDDPTPLDLHPPATTAAKHALAALEQPAGLDFVDVPLDRVLAELSERCGVPIVMDRWGIERHFTPRYRITSSGSDRLAVAASRREVEERLINAKVSQLPLRDALKNMLEFPEIRLRPAVRDEVIWITTQQQADSLLMTRLYPVHDLFPDHLAVSEWDYEDPCASLQNLIARKTWLDPRVDATIATVGGVLVIRQEPETHRQIENVLSGIRRMLDPSQPRLASLAIPAESPADKRLFDRTSIQINSIPLRDVVDHLRQRHELAIFLDEMALEAEGFSGDIVVSAHAEDVPLEQLLRQLLRPFGLTFVARGSSVKITTKSALEAERQLWLYDVRHLVDPDLGIANPWELARITKGLLAPYLQDDGSVQTINGILVVSHSCGAQYEAISLLAALTKYQQQPQSFLPISYFPQGTDMHPRLHEKLGQDVSIRLAPMPLHRAVRVLSQELAVPIELDPNAFSDFGVAIDARVSLTARGISLGAALNALVGNLGLAYCVRDGRILISDTQTCELAHVGCVYNVRDLLHHPARTPDLPSGPYHPPVAVPTWTVRVTTLDSELLRDLVGNHVDATTWDDVGGTGVLASCEGALVVSNSRPAHEKTERLLTQLRHTLWPQRHSQTGWTRVERALDKPVKLPCNRVTVRDLLAQVSKEHEISVVLDPGNPKFRLKPASFLVPFAEDPFRHQRNSYLFEDLFGDNNQRPQHPANLWSDAGRALARTRSTWAANLCSDWWYDLLYGPSSRIGRRQSMIATLRRQRENPSAAKHRLTSPGDHLFIVLSPFFARPDDDPFGLVRDEDGTINTATDPTPTDIDSAIKPPHPSLEDPLATAAPLPRLLWHGGRWMLNRWRLELDVGDTMLSDNPAPDDVETIPLGKAIQNTLEPIGLTVGVDGESLRVGSLEDQRPLPFTRVYDVRKLLCRKESEKSLQLRPAPYITTRMPVVGSPADAVRLPPSAIFGTFGFVEIVGDGFPEFVMKNVAPETWADNGGFGILHVYHGLLVATNTWEVHYQLRQYLDDLHRALAELQPASVSSESRPAADVEKVVGLIVNSQSDHVLAYGEYLFDKSDFPAALVVPAIVKRLEAVDPKFDFDAQRPFFRILCHYGPKAAEAVPILAKQLSAIEDNIQRCIVIETLGFIGDAAGPALAKYLNSNFDRVSQDDAEREQLVKALTLAGESSVDALEPLLRLLAAAEKRDDRHRLTESLPEIDPDGRRCREIVRRWKNSKDEQTHQLGYTTEERVQAVFGDPF